MANFMGMTLARDIHLGRLLGAGRPPRGAMLEGVRVYTSDQTHFSIARALDELGFPPETLVVIPSDARSGCAARPVAAADRARPGGRPDAVRDRRRRRLDEHRLGRRDRRAGRPRRGRGPVAPRRRGLRRRGAAVRPRRRPGAGPRRGPIRSPSTRTSGSSRPTTSAGWWSATGRTWPRRSAAARPSTTAAASAAPACERRRPRRPTPTSSTSTSSASRAPGAGGRSSCGCRGSTSAPRASAGSIEANDDLAAHLARRCAEADDFEALPEVPGAVGRLLPPPARWPRRGAGLAARRARRPPGPAPGRARGVRRRLADDDAAARRDLPARRDRQLPRDRGRHRPPARDAPATGRSAPRPGRQPILEPEPLADERQEPRPALVRRRHERELEPARGPAARRRPATPRPSCRGGSSAPRRSRSSPSRRSRRPASGRRAASGRR